MRVGLHMLEAAKTIARVADDFDRINATESGQLMVFATFLRQMADKYAVGSFRPTP